MLGRSGDEPGGLSLTWPVICQVGREIPPLITYWLLSFDVGSWPVVWAAIHTTSTKGSVCKFISCEKFSLHHFLATLSRQIAAEGLWSVSVVCTFVCLVFFGWQTEFLVSLADVTDFFSCFNNSNWGDAAIRHNWVYVSLISTTYDIVEKRHYKYLSVTAGNVHTACCVHHSRVYSLLPQGGYVVTFVLVLVCLWTGLREKFSSSFPPVKSSEAVFSIPYGIME